jgi:hypothetical protein
MDGHVVGSFDTDPDRVPVDLDDRHLDVATNLKPLTELPAQD